MNMSTSDSIVPPRATRKLRILAWPAFDPRTGNPYCKNLYDALHTHGADVYEFGFGRALLQRFDIFHVHWPEHYLNKPLPKAIVGIHLVIVALQIQRVLGATTIWTVHNLASHDHRHRLLERYFWALFLRLLDGFTSLSKSGVVLAEATHPLLKTKAHYVVPHGHYQNDTFTPKDKKESREQLQLSVSDKVLLFVGRIRKYKNVTALIRTFKATRDATYRLLIVGLPDDEALRAAILRDAEGDPRISLYLGWADDDSIRLYTGACDLVVLPFSEILNSGSALLGLSLSKPLLVPAKGAMPDLVQSMGEEWVQLYDEPLTTSVLENAVRWALSTERLATPPLASLSWDHIGRLTLVAFASLRGGKQLRESR